MIKYSTNFSKRFFSLSLSPPIIFLFRVSGIARTQIPTIKNYALDIPTLGVFARVSLIVVQWRGLAQEEPPSWSRYPPRQVSYREIRARLNFNCFCNEFFHTRNNFANRPLAAANQYIKIVYCSFVHSE